MSRLTLADAIDLLVPELNARINIPGIWDETEEAANIRSGLEYIMPAMPEEMYPFLVSAADGLTDKETERYLEITLNSAVRTAVAPLPYFAKAFVGTQLHDALEPMARIVFEYAQAGMNLALNEPEETEFPEEQE